MHIGPGVTTAGDETAGYDTPVPTPADGETFGYGPSTANKQWVYITAFAATRQLVQTAEQSPSLGTTTVADATGQKAKGVIANKIVVGVIGQAPCGPSRWGGSKTGHRVPDRCRREQGTGFAFACVSQGVPWMIVRRSRHALLRRVRRHHRVGPRRQGRRLCGGPPHGRDQSDARDLRISRLRPTPRSPGTSSRRGRGSLSAR